MRIRSYRRRDARALVALVRALARYEKLRPPTAAAMRRIVADAGKRIRVWIAEHEGRAVGYAIWFFTYSSFLAKPTLYLEDLFVLPECRGLGIGRAMFDRLHREAKRAGCGRMEWAVLKWNKPALGFYRKLGARPLDEWLTMRLTLPHR